MPEWFLSVVKRNLFLGCVASLFIENAFVLIQVIFLADYFNVQEKKYLGFIPSTKQTKGKANGRIDICIIPYNICSPENRASFINILQNC